MEGDMVSNGGEKKNGGRIPSNGKKETHVLMIPYPSPGHMLPHFILSHHLALRGIKVTILISPKNLPLLTNFLSMHPSMQTLVLPFPPHPSIPLGVENMKDIPIFYIPDIISASEQLYDPIRLWFQSHRSPPVAIIPDTLLNCWTLRLAQELDVKLVAFTPMHASSLRGWSIEIEKKLHFPMSAWIMEPHLATQASWGVIVNSFTELERESVEWLKKTFLKNDRVWASGPFLPIKFNECGTESTPVHEAITWLDSCKEDKSVIYIGFGTQITLSGRQMEALATALDVSGAKFIWSIKEPMKGVQVEGGQNVVPVGFEERVSGRGLLVKGWAPQAAILNHRAVGAYLTHCGWNSVLEGLCGGVLLLAWPMQADHFFNATLLADECRAAIRVCEGLETVPDSAKLARVLAESVSSTRPEWVRAMELRKYALEAIKDGGSSYKALDGLAQALSELN